MCDIWKGIGESVNEELVDTLFDPTYIETLSGKYATSTVTKAETVEITEDNKQEIIDAASMLTKRKTVEFQISTALFTDPKAASKELDEFVETAKVLDGAIIKVAGNCDPNPISDPKDELNKKLSKSRAEAVKKYLVSKGVDGNRIVTVGNGSKDPIVPNDTDENRAKNRRVDVSFIQLG